MVNVLHASSAVPAIFDEVLALDHLPSLSKVIWMQLIVRHDENATRPSIKVIMNR